MAATAPPAMHIAAAEPRFVRREEVTPEVLEREKEIFRDQAAATGKPPVGSARESCKLNHVNKT